MILATQTLARLNGLTEADRTRDLRASVFANLAPGSGFQHSACGLTRRRHPMQSLPTD